MLFERLRGNLSNNERNLSYSNCLKFIIEEKIAVKRFRLLPYFTNIATNEDIKFG